MRGVLTPSFSRGTRCRPFPFKPKRSGVASHASPECGDDLPAGLQDVVPCIGQIALHFAVRASQVLITATQSHFASRECIRIRFNCPKSQEHLVIWVLHGSPQRADPPHSLDQVDITAQHRRGKVEKLLAACGFAIRLIIHLQSLALVLNSTRWPVRTFSTQ